MRGSRLLVWLAMAMLGSLPMSLAQELPELVIDCDASQSLQKALDTLGAGNGEPLRRFIHR